MAYALRGMARGAPVLVRMPDGGLRPVVLVRPVLLGGDSTTLGGAASASAGAYAIALELAGG